MQKVFKDNKVLISERNDNNLQTHVLAWKSPRLVKMESRRVRKDERRKDLEVICHSGLNNFCNMIVPLPKSQTRHPARPQAPSISHKCFIDTKLYKPLPLFAFLFALTRSPNLRTKTACREQIPEAFKRDLVLTIGRRGRIL